MDKTLNLKQVLKRLLSEASLAASWKKAPRVQFKILKHAGFQVPESASGDS